MPSAILCIPRSEGWTPSTVPSPSRPISSGREKGPGNNAAKSPRPGASDWLHHVSTNGAWPPEIAPDTLCPADPPGLPGDRSGRTGRLRWNGRAHATRNKPYPHPSCPVHACESSPPPHGSIVLVPVHKAGLLRPRGNPRDRMNPAIPPSSLPPRAWLTVALLWPPNGLQRFRDGADALETFMITDEDWVQSATFVDPDYWVAQVFIPTDCFGSGPLEAGQSLRVAVCRYDVGDNPGFVLSSTAPLREPSYHRREEWHQILLTAAP